MYGLINEGPLIVYILYKYISIINIFIVDNIIIIIIINYGHIYIRRNSHTCKILYMQNISLPVYMHAIIRYNAYIRTNFIDLHMHACHILYALTFFQQCMHASIPVYTAVLHNTSHKACASMHAWNLYIIYCICMRIILLYTE